MSVIRAPKGTTLHGLVDKQSVGRIPVPADPSETSEAAIRPLEVGVKVLEKVLAAYERLLMPSEPGVAR